MKRFHAHVAVSAHEQSTRFYSAMFGMPPAVLKNDYAKWMLDDPRGNFAHSEHADAAGAVVGTCSTSCCPAIEPKTAGVKTTAKACCNG